MISSPTQIVLDKTTVKLALVSHEQRQSKLILESKPQFNVISAGLQGPVGTVAEDVLAKAASAELAAMNASTVSDQVSTDLELLVTDLNNAFVYHTGAISAQGG